MADAQQNDAHQAVAVEILCARVCITFMFCFTFEKKHRGSSASDELVGHHIHRMSARGNATSFPMPRDDSLRQLHTGDIEQQMADIVQLACTGEELVVAVSMLFKTADRDESDTGMATLNHQDKSAPRRRGCIGCTFAATRAPRVSQP